MFLLLYYVKYDTIRGPAKEEDLTFRMQKQPGKGLAARIGADGEPHMQARNQERCGLAENQVLTECQTRHSKPGIRFYYRRNS